MPIMNQLDEIRTAMGTQFKEMHSHLGKKADGHHVPSIIAQLEQLRSHVGAKCYDLQTNILEVRKSLGKPFNPPADGAPTISELLDELRENKADVDRVPTDEEFHRLKATV